ncbi:hypothetical protein AeNC1_006980 [Aphanomyces euteiches]|nr:hypothetical protein AeNC1_006980 [Aphanomyces euteiches]
MPIIKNHIAQGTIIVSGKFASYISAIERHTLANTPSLRHTWVNHWNNFVNPDKGAHTQRYVINELTIAKLLCPRTSFKGYDAKVRHRLRSLTVAVVGITGGGEARGWLPSYNSYVGFTANGLASSLSGLSLPFRRT